jgi:glycosyltransferase involved in cell wall biosynthesis
MIPSTLLSKVFPYIRKRAKTVNIIHHNRLPKDPAFFALKWDAIVCFDERYYKFLVKAYPKERIHIIPYPCHPMKLGKKSVARRMLNLPCKEYILLLFGQKIREQMEILPVLERLSEKIPLLLLVVSANDLYCLRNYKGRLKILIREESPGIERLYTYLHAADALLYHRVPPPGVVVSSTAYQCLGSGCPMLALDSAYFYNFNGAIFVYKDLFEFEEKLLHILRKDTLYKKWQKSLKAFIKKNSAPRIAASYIRLFRSLLEC